MITFFGHCKVALKTLDLNICYIRTRCEKVEHGSWIQNKKQTEKSYFLLLKNILTLIHNTQLISPGARILLSTPKGM